MLAAEVGAGPVDAVQRHRDLEDLFAIAHVGAAPGGGLAAVPAGHAGAALGFQRVEQGAHAASAGMPPASSALRVSS